MSDTTIKDIVESGPYGRLFTVATPNYIDNRTVYVFRPSIQSDYSGPAALATYRTMVARFANVPAFHKRTDFGRGAVAFWADVAISEADAARIEETLSVADAVYYIHEADEEGAIESEWREWRERDWPNMRPAVREALGYDFATSWDFLNWYDQADRDLSGADWRKMTEFDNFENFDGGWVIDLDGLTKHLRGLGWVKGLNRPT